MVAIRRSYIFLVCAISLQSVAWAIIALLSNLLTDNTWDTVTATAFQISVVVIGLPVFLVHWLWAQNLAGKEIEEREADLRAFYLYGTLAAFLGPIATNTFDLLATLFGLIFKVQRASYFTFLQARPAEFITRELVAIAVLTLLWLYHRWVTVEDAKASADVGAPAGARRLYIFGFSAAGAWTVTMGIINVLAWVMTQVIINRSVTANFSNLMDDAARLMVGLPLWLIFWRWAQTLFISTNQEERQSVLRKFYLYATIFIATLTIVSNAIIILADWFHRLLKLSAQYGLSLGDFRLHLATILGMLILWAYHTIILRQDAALAGEEPRQAEVRRLYLYLVAGIGLAAFLIGLSGSISVLIRIWAEHFASNTLLDQLTWFTATLLAGLPVWIFPWRQSQTIAVASTPSGASERRSTARKIYLYLYLFAATISALSSAIYIAFRLLSLGLGQRDDTNLLSDLGSAIAYCIIAICVWLYHGYAVRGDGRINRRQQIKQLESLQIAVVDDTDGRFGHSVLEGLRRELPGVTLNPIALTEMAAQTMGSTLQGIPALLASARLIVGPSNLTFVGGAVSGEVAQAVRLSPARKLLVPVWSAGCAWVGVDRWPAEAITRQTVHAVKQIVTGEEVKPARPLGAGAIVGIIMLVFLILIFILILINIIF